MCDAGKGCISHYIDVARKFLKSKKFSTKLASVKGTKGAQRFVDGLLKALDKTVDEAVKIAFKKGGACYEPEDDKDDQNIVVIIIDGDNIKLSDLKSDDVSEILKNFDKDDIKKAFGKNADKTRGISKKDKAKIFDEIKNKMKEPEDWEEEDVDNVEGILEGADVDTLRKIKDSTVKKRIKTLANSTGTSLLKKRTLLEKCKNKTVFGELREWTKEIIDEAKDLLTSLSKDEIESMAKIQFSRSIKSFGSQKWTLIASVKAIIKKLKEDRARRGRLLEAQDYGSDLESWSAQEILDLGTLINGLTYEEVAYVLSTEAILSISPLAFDSFESNVASAVAFRISQMTSSQVNSFSQDQVNAMNGEVLDAYKNAGGTDEPDSSDTGLYVGIAAGVVAALALAFFLVNKRTTSGGDRTRGKSVELGNPASNGSNKGDMYRV
jgi:hypothetical protein